MTTPVLPRPDHILEMNFTNTDDGPVWTNLTDYVELDQGLKISKRRQNVFDDVSPATLALALDNTGGVFNNDKVSSPFFGQVLLDVPSRFRVRWPRVPTDTNNLLSDVQSLGSDASAFTADQGSLDVDATFSSLSLDDDNADYGGSWNTRTDASDYNGSCQEINTNGNTASFTFTGTSVIWYGEKNSDHGIASLTLDGASVGTVDLYNATRTYQNALYTSPTLAPGQHTLVITVTATKNASSTGFWISVDRFDISATATPPSGRTADIIWSTGVLDTTGVQVLTGVGQAPNRIPDDEEPIYVLPSTSYSARLQVKGDSKATGISFAVKARIRWYDIDGNYLSDSDSASPTTLTTSYQAVSVGPVTSPANAALARCGIVSQTLVAPAVRTVVWNGSDTQTTSYGTSRTVTIPSNAAVGDVLLAWVRINNPSLTITQPGIVTFVNSWTDSKGKTQLCRYTVQPGDAGRKLKWTFSQKCGAQVALTNYSHVHPSTLIHQINETTEGTFRATHTTPNVTTTLASCLIVSAVFDVSSTTKSWGAPGTETVRNTMFRTGGNSPTGIVSDFGAPQAAGTYGSKVFTSNTSSKAATMHTLALAPATTTGPGSVTVQFGSVEFVQGSVGSWQQGGNWEALFTGLSDSWQNQYEGDFVYTQYAATDRQKQLASINVGSALYETIRSAGPIAYYKLDESESGNPLTTHAANSAQVYQEDLAPAHFGSNGVLNWAQGTGPGVDGSSALVNVPQDRSNGYALSTTLVHPLANADQVSLSGWFASTQNDSLARSFSRVQDTLAGSNPRSYFQIAGFAGVSVYAEARIYSENATYLVTATKSTNYWDGKTHNVTGTCNITGGQIVVTLYVDGVQQAQSTLACGVAQFPTMNLLGVTGTPKVGYITNGTHSHYALFDWELDADTVNDIYTAGTTAFAGDTITDRMGRLADWELQDSISFDATDTVVARHMPDTVSLQDALRTAAKSEGGTFFITGEGEIAFRSRDTKQLTTTPLITVNAFEVDKQAFSKVTDDALLVNNPQIKILDTGAIVQLTDTDSQLLHGTYTKPIDTILSSNADALNYATYLLAFYSEGSPRCETVQLEGLLMQDWANVILTDIWQILRITGLPSTEQVTTMDLFIEGFEFSLDGDHWQLTFDTSTAIPFCVLNDSTRGICGASVVAW